MKIIIVAFTCLMGAVGHAFPTQLLEDNSGTLEWRNQAADCGVIYSPNEFELGYYLVEYYEKGEVLFEGSKFNLGDQIPRYNKSKGSHKFNLNLGPGYQVEILPQNDSYSKINVTVSKSRFWSGVEVIRSCKDATLVVQ